MKTIWNRSGSNFFNLLLCLLLLHTSHLISWRMCGGIVMVNSQHLESFRGSNMIFMFVVSSSSPYGSLRVIFVFANFFLHLCVFFVGLHLHLTSKFTHGVLLTYRQILFLFFFFNMQVYIMSLIFFIPKTSFSQIYISVIDHE